MKTNLTIKINGKLEESFEHVLYNDLKKFGDVFCETIVKNATPKIKEFADKEIAGYYAEYHPEYYKRTNQMKTKSFKPFTITGSKYEGGIKFDSSYTHHHGGFYPKWGSPNPGFKDVEDQEQQIFQSVWDLGLHGRKGTNHYTNTYHIFDETGKDEFELRTLGEKRYIQGKPYRLEHLVEQVYSADFLNKMIQMGLDKASKQRYSVLKFY